MSCIAAQTPADASQQDGGWGERPGGAGLLRILSNNIRGKLEASSLSLLRHLEDKSPGVRMDIFCFSETKLQETSSGKVPAVPDYTVHISNKRAGDAGAAGVCTMVHSSWAARILSTHDVVPPGRIGGVTLSLGQGCPSLSVLSVYGPSGNASTPDIAARRKEFLASLREQLRSITDARNEVIVAGDFNIALDVVRNGDGSDAADLEDIMADFNLTDAYRLMHPEDDGATRDSGYRIDYVFVSPRLAECLTRCDLHAELSLGSTDHYPIITCLDLAALGATAPQLPEATKRIIVTDNPKQRRLFEQQIITMLEEGATTEVNAANTESEAERLCKLLVTAAEQTFGRRSTAVTTRRYPIKPALGTLSKLKHKLQTALAAFDRGSRPSSRLYSEANDCLGGLQKYCVLPLNVTGRTRGEIADIYSDCVAITRCMHAQLARKQYRWKVSSINYFLARRDRAFDRCPDRNFANRVRQEARKPQPTALIYNGVMICEPNGVKQHSHDHFAGIMEVDPKPPEGIKSPFDTPLYHDRAPAAITKEEALADIGEEEWRAAVAHSRSNTAVGMDELGANMLKAAPELFHTHLREACNGILRDARSGCVIVWPKSWKQTIIVPIPKGDSDARCLGNTRPISLTPVVARIVCTILARRLKKAIQAMIHPAQAAFMAERSTLDHIMTVRLCVEHARASKKAPLYIGCLDIAKAYDTVPWYGLEDAMRRCHFPPELVNLIMDMHHGTEARVRTAYGLSDPITQRRGMLQGNPISCLLFALFMDPLLCQLDRRMQGYKVPTAETILGGTDALYIIARLCAYADDLTLLAKTLADLAKGFKVVARFVQYVCMSVAVHKCMVTAIHKHEPPQEDMQVKIGDEVVPVLPAGKAFRNLGVYQSNDSKWNEQSLVTGKMLRRTAQAVWNRRLTIPQVKWFMNACLMPAALYSLAAGCSSHRGAADLGKLCNRIARNIANLPQHIAGATVNTALQYGGLGVNELGTMADAFLLKHALVMLEQPESLPGKLLRARLAWWQRKQLGSVFCPLEIEGATAQLDSVHHPKESGWYAVRLVQTLKRYGLSIRVKSWPIVQPQISRSFEPQPTSPHPYYPTEFLIDPTRPKQQLTTSRKDAWPTGLYAADMLNRNGIWGPQPDNLSQQYTLARITLGPHHRLPPACDRPAIAQAPTASCVQIYCSDVATTLRYPAPAATPNRRTFYTDGSFDRDKNTSAFAAVEVSTDGAVIHQARLRGAQSIYKAELLGITHALRVAPKDRTCILTDSQSSILAINGFLKKGLTTRQRLTQPCADVVEEAATLIAQSGHENPLQKVKAHAGELGNEMADTAAKIATRARWEAAGLEFTSSRETVVLAHYRDDTRLPPRIVVRRLESSVVDYVKAHAAVMRMNVRASLRQQGAKMRPEHAATVDPVLASDPSHALLDIADTYPQMPPWAAPSCSKEWREWGRLAMIATSNWLPTNERLFAQQRADSRACDCGAPVQDEAHVYQRCRFLRPQRTHLRKRLQLLVQQCPPGPTNQWIQGQLDKHDPTLLLPANCVREAKQRLPTTKLVQKSQSEAVRALGKFAVDAGRMIRMRRRANAPPNQ